MPRNPFSRFCRKAHALHGARRRGTLAGLVPSSRVDAGDAGALSVGMTCGASFRKTFASEAVL
ncbi:hypothetical protein [Variovorax sp.]|uniref:hypothetical protein n=1 Tax=Variovorax sp. TaxID=1871043 RepID=UPI002D52D4DA|nr:hypothetical protein [Variovorax sp.]HYP84257.1 hypothetical protein [Variovorax sp.]